MIECNATVQNVQSWDVLCVKIMNGSTTRTLLGLVLFAWELTSPPLGSIINLKHAPSLSRSRSTNERHLHYFSPLWQKQIPKPKKEPLPCPSSSSLSFLIHYNNFCAIKNTMCVSTCPNKTRPSHVSQEKQFSMTPVSLSWIIYCIKCLMEHCEHADKSI